MSHCIIQELALTKLSNKTAMNPRNTFQTVEDISKNLKIYVYADYFYAKPEH